MVAVAVVRRPFALPSMSATSTGIKYVALLWRDFFWHDTKVNKKIKSKHNLRWTNFISYYFYITEDKKGPQEKEKKWKKIPESLKLKLAFQDESQMLGNKIDKKD